jgi:putative acetyltransferase
MIVNSFDIVIAEEDSCSADGQRLIAAAGEELDTMYSEISVCPLDPEVLSGPSAAFVVARWDGVAIGCGGVHCLYGKVGELKRIYVIPEARRKGLARRILAVLEQKALDLGYPVVWLETGIRQPEAIALYNTSGYSEMTCYGPYEDDGWSVCFQKTLG